jgi:hypothetical protein
MNATIGAFGKDEYLVLGLIAWLAYPALPAGGCAFHCLLLNWLRVLQTGLTSCSMELVVSFAIWLKLL